MLIQAVSGEVQIVLAVCAFYLYDACIALQANEALMARSRSGWSCMLGADGFEMKRAFLRWPPPLFHQPVYVLAWQDSFADLSGRSAAVRQMAGHACSFGAFRIPLHVLALALFAMLPASLLWTHSDLIRLLAVALIYCCTVWLAVLTLRHGRQGHTPRHDARSIALQILCCPPFALNVVRKLSLLQKYPCELPQAAFQLLPAGPWQQLASRLHCIAKTELDQVRDLPGHGAQVEHLENVCAALRAHTVQE